MYKITEFDDAIMISVDTPSYPDNCPELKECFEDILAQDSAKVFLDLSAVGVMYSSGITELVQLFSQLKAANRVLVIIGIQDGIFNIFKLLGLHQLFIFAANVEEAQGI